jgi:hypothetical protein
MTDISHLNRAQGIALTNDGEILRITHWLDVDGLPSDPDLAVACVAGPSASGEWHSIDLSAFETARMQ